MTYNLPNTILYILLATFLIYAINVARNSSEYQERQLKALHTPTQSVIIRETVCEEPQVIIKDWYEEEAVSEEEYEEITNGELNLFYPIVTEPKEFRY